MAAKVSFETVKKLGLQLPQAEEGMTWGKPALKIKGKAFVCMSSHSSADPDSLVVRTDFEQRAELIAADPDVYYITPHYENYPAVLVRLPRIKPAVLKDVLGMAYRFILRESSKKSSAKKK